MNELIQDCLEDYKRDLAYYEKIQCYYQGKTDPKISKSQVDMFSTGKIRNNYLKKFIKEEVDYILGNDVVYINQGSPDEDLEQIVNYQFEHWAKDHDKKLFRRALLYGKAYEIYYVDSEGQFSGRILTPLNGYPYFEKDQLRVFLHIFKKKFDDSTVYMDCYDNNNIYHYANNELTGRTPHIFGSVPVGVCVVDDADKDILYEDIKTLQDAYETNISDLSHEITQYRQAYLKVLNIELDEKDLPKMKQLGILQGAGKDVDISWLTKDINDAFVMNTLKEIKDNLYELSGHINHNEQLPSNNSSLAMRSRQLNLENKCKSNAAAMYNLIRDRIKMLFKYLYILQNKQYDYRDVEPKFTVSLPQDDLMMSQIISQIARENLISKHTARAQFSFIDNVSLEADRVKRELEEENQIDLDKLGDVDAESNPEA